MYDPPRAGITLVSFKLNTKVGIVVISPSLVKKALTSSPICKPTPTFKPLVKISVAENVEFCPRVKLVGAVVSKLKTRS